MLKWKEGFMNYVKFEGKKYINTTGEDIEITRNCEVIFVVPACDMVINPEPCYITGVLANSKKTCIFKRDNNVEIWLSKNKTDDDTIIFGTRTAAMLYPEIIIYGS